MRLRNIKGAQEAITDSVYTVNEPKQQKNRWKEYFHNTNPVHIEIGMGKGRFITELAQKNPDINYIGIEKYSSVLIRAIEKLEAINGSEENAVKNLVFIRMNAEDICDVFGAGEVGRIYLNFSDPWPKDRHAKRRLTSQEFFKRYHNILIPDGRVEFKTDNKDLFNFSLSEIPLAGWQITESTRNLHHDEKMLEGNVMTEYEEKFSSLGHPIYKLIARRHINTSV